MFCHSYRMPLTEILLDSPSALNNHHTLAVYRYACMALFERHKLLFAFLLCIQILRSEGKIDDVGFSQLISAFVHPLTVLFRPRTTSSCAEGRCWIGAYDPLTRVPTGCQT